MKLNELPQNIQEQLRAERTQLCTKWKMNNAYHIVFANAEGTRYFQADRVCESYSDNKGNYMPFGGGSYWSVKYGKILWDWNTNPVGEKEYYWKRTSQIFCKSPNGTEIKAKVATKKEVLEIAKATGIFDI